jgi:hypothetical protein
VSDGLLKRAELAALPGGAFAAIKANRVTEILLKHEAKAKQKNEHFLDCWFSEQAQDLLKVAARKF